MNWAAFEGGGSPKNSTALPMGGFGDGVCHQGHVGAPVGASRGPFVVRLARGAPVGSPTPVPRRPPPPPEQGLFSGLGKAVQRDLHGQVLAAFVFRAEKAPEMPVARG